MSEENKNTIEHKENVINRSAVKVAIKVISSMWKRNQKIIWIDLAATSALSIFVSGYLTQIGQVAVHKIRRVTLGGILTSAFTDTFILTILFFIVLNVFMYRLASALYKETVVDEDRNYNASLHGSKGTAHKMTPAEAEQRFQMGDYSEIKDLILGASIDNISKMYALKFRNGGFNRNMLILGPPGEGKTTCYLVQFIFQIIRMEQSAIVTDPKGELYRMAAATARANGYVVKMLNFKPEFLLHSDTANYMSVVGRKTYVAQSFSKTVIDNTNDGKIADFWTDSEFNLFIGCCLIISTNNLGLPKTLGGVYRLLNTNSVDSFEELCSTLSERHPAMPFINTFMNGDKTVKGNTYAGLQIRLSSIANPIVQKLVDTDDIDFTLPGKQKCLYFIGSDDSDSSMDYLVALFITLICQQLKSYADKQPTGHLPIRTTLIFEELASIGRIPDFVKKLATFRGRWIDIISVIQNLPQLQKMYPENEWESIISCCYTKIVMGANDNTTSEYWSKYAGTQTVEEVSKRYTEHVGDILKIHPEYNVTEQYAERNLYNPDEIMNLDPDNVLVFLSKSRPIEMRKAHYSTHPMCKEMRTWNPSEHLPAWIKTLPKSELREFEVAGERYRLESTEDIVLCTEDDYKEPWTPKKEEALQKYIKEYAKQKKNGTAKKNQQQNKPVESTIRTANADIAADVIVNNIGSDIASEFFGSTKTADKGDRQRQVPVKSENSASTTNNSGMKKDAVNNDLPLSAVEMDISEDSKDADDFEIDMPDDSSIPSIDMDFSDDGIETTELDFSGLFDEATKFTKLSE